jgi:hypothetical protein
VPGQPIKHAVIEAIAELAAEEMGPDASALEYVCQHIENGGRIKELQNRIAKEWHIEVSQPFFSQCLRALGENAKEKIAEAKKASPPALVERAWNTVAEASTDRREDLEKAKEEAKILLWQAERLDRQTYGPAQQATASINVLNFGQAHLEAFKAIGIPAPPTSTQVLLPASSQTVSQDAPGSPIGPIAVPEPSPGE